MTMTMKTKLNSLRRIRIPLKIFNKLDFSDGQAVEISIQYGEICVVKFQKEDLHTRPFIGIVRYLDSSLRFGLPTEYLDLLDLHLGDMVYLEVVNDVIKIKK